MLIGLVWQVCIFSFILLTFFLHEYSFILFIVGPCYPSAVHNVKHIGNCVGQLINRILDSGTENIHLVGFSLGAQVTNYASKTVAPFRLPRITGLDPAMPLFITSSLDEKLDASDAEFVDVIHTNALVQVRNCSLAV